MNKIPAFILTDEFSTAEVLKLYLSEYDNIEIMPTSQNYSDLQDKIISLESSSLLVIDLSYNKEQKLEFIPSITKE